jgi:2-iminobutanoate/2-iminopropanoate deaminase
MLFIAGSTAGGTAAATGDIAAKTEAILDKFEVILAANGGSLSNVIKVTSFVTDLREAAAAGEVRMKRFSGAFPARTQVQVAALGTPDLKIEIDAIAIIPD